jgi:hypothetical protein
MDDGDKREFADVLKAVLDLYGKEASAPVLRLWWAALNNFSIEEVRHGLTRFVRSADSGTFAPKPADIIRMIEGTSGDRGMLAWSKVQEAFGRVGGWQSVAFDDGIIHACIEDMGGWPKLCSTEGDEMPFRSAEFAKRYRAYAEAGICRFPPYLTGRHEAGNRLHCQKVQPPMLIGDPEKAALVIQAGQDMPRLRITSGNMIEQVLTGLKALEDK